MSKRSKGNGTISDPVQVPETTESVASATETPVQTATTEETTVSPEANGKKPRKTPDHTNRPIYLLTGRQEGAKNSEIIATADTMGQASKKFPEIHSVLERFYPTVEVYRAKKVVLES